MSLRGAPGFDTPLGLLNHRAPRSNLPFCTMSLRGAAKRRRSNLPFTGRILSIRIHRLRGDCFVGENALLAKTCNGASPWQLENNIVFTLWPMLTIRFYTLA